MASKKANEQFGLFRELLQRDPLDDGGKDALENLIEAVVEKSKASRKKFREEWLPYLRESPPAKPARERLEPLVHALEENGTIHVTYSNDSESYLAHTRFEFEDGTAVETHELQKLCEEFVLALTPREYKCGYENGYGDERSNIEGVGTIALDEHGHVLFSHFDARWETWSDELSYANVPDTAVKGNLGKFLEKKKKSGKLYVYDAIIILTLEYRAYSTELSGLSR